MEAVWQGKSAKGRKMVLLTLIFIDSSSVADSALLSVNDRKRILSKASEAFEINSLKKIWGLEECQIYFSPFSSFIPFLMHIIALIYITQKRW